MPPLNIPQLAVGDRVRFISWNIPELSCEVLVEADGTVGLGLPAQHRAYELFEARDVSIERLLDSKLYAAQKSKNYDNFYGRSWLLFHYLFTDDARRNQIVDYLNRLNRGEAELPAATAAFGDLKALDKALDSLGARRIGGIADRIVVGRMGDVLGIEAVHRGAGGAHRMHADADRAGVPEAGREAVLTGGGRVLARGQPGAGHLHHLAARKRGHHGAWSRLADERDGCRRGGRPAGDDRLDGRDARGGDGRAASASAPC